MFDVEIKNLKVFANIGITSNESRYKTLEKLIISSSQMLEKKFKIKKVKVKINKTAVAKRYGSETVSVSN